MRLLLAFFFFSVAGCGGAKINVDRSIPATQANYPTAEFRACGRLWHGLGGCQLKTGQSLDDLNIEVQGYYSGMVRIIGTGDECQFDEVVSYSNNSVIPVHIPKKIQTNCTIGFLVSPQIPHAKDQPVVIRSFMGFLRIRATDQNWAFSKYETMETDGASIQLQPSGFNPGEQVRVVAKGCSQSIDQIMLVESIRLSLSAIQAQNCFLEVAIIGSKAQVQTIGLTSYSSVFAPLAAPVIENGWVYAGPDVAVITVDDKFYVGSEVKYKKQPSIVRVLSTAGRSVIMIRNTEGVWEKL